MAGAARVDGAGTVGARLTSLRVPDHRSTAELRRLATWHMVGPLVGAAFVAVRPWGTTATSLLVGVLVAATLLGATVHLWLRRPRSAEEVARADMAVFVGDVCLLVAAGAVAEESPFALLVIPLLVAAKLRRLAIPVTVVVLGLAVLLRQWLLAVIGSPAPSVSVTVQLVLFGTAIAAIMSQMLDQLEVRRAAAVDQAERSRVHEQRATILHRVTLAGVGATRRASIEGAVRAAEDLLPGSRWGYVCLNEADPTLLTGRGVVPDRLVEVARAVGSDGQAKEVPGWSDADQARTTIATPVSGRSGDDGVLLFSPAGGIGDDERALANAAADLFAVLVEAALAYEHETELVDRYRALDRLRSDFVSLTSHELRTPVTVIQGFAETLATRDFDDVGAVAPLADAIVRHTERLGRVVDDVRLISTIDAGRLRIDTHAFDVADAVQDALRGLEAEGLTVDGPSGLRIVSDPRRLAQIVSLLVQNATHHGAAPITLRWWQDDQHLVLDVQDTGPGIPAELHETVFERFRTGGDLLSHRRGTGLGLPIARELANLLGGSVDLVPSTAGVLARLTLPSASPATGGPD